MDDTARDAVRKALRERRNELARLVVAGNCQTFPDYRHMTGQIAGLETADEIVKDTFQSHYNLEDDDDDED